MVTLTSTEAQTSYFDSGHAVASGTSTNALALAQEQEDDRQLDTFFCRALYDYEAQDPSALSFRAGTVIEVISQQPSGWWDGILGNERGWFPSNYVTIISDDEGLQALSDSELSGAESSAPAPESFSDTVDMTQALMSGSQSENEEWLEREVSRSRDKASSRSRSNTGPSARSKAQPGDYWMPEVTPDHQIWFVNERTGERARDIPRESEDEASDVDLGGFTSQSSSRSTASLPFNGANASPEIPTATTTNSRTKSVKSETVSDGRATPEPWVKKLWNDGTSYYYYNTVDGTTQWTRPASVKGSSTATGALADAASRPAAKSSSRLSVYSDSSDVQPLDYISPGRSKPREERKRPENGQKVAAIELTSAEKIAQDLQKALEPPPPEKVADLSSIARGTIQAVIEHIKMGSIYGGPEDFALLDDLVGQIVTAVRNLLYVAAIPTGHIPSSVLPRGEGSSRSSQASPLKPAQRKVTATLSRLVLSARAMQYDSGSQVNDTLNRIESDAEELERAILSFVLGVQRSQHHGDAGSQGKPKRLHGVFSTSNIGLGLVGAGAAASWTGLGWVQLDNEKLSPKRTMEPAVASEITTYLSQLQDTIAGLGHALRSTSNGSVEQVRQSVQQTVAQVSSFLTFVADINIARHIDIDGIHQGETSASDQYAKTVENARRLVRTLETVVQALYDDASALFLTMQNIRDEDLAGDKEATYDLLDKLATSLSSNLTLCRQTTESILSVGHEQADMDQTDYEGSIGWRMSRLSVITSQFGGGQAPFKPNDSYYDSEQEGVIDLADAFNRPGVKKGTYQQQDPAAYESELSLAKTNGTSMADVSGTDVSSIDRSLIDDDADLFDDEFAPKPKKSKKGKDLETWLGNEYADKVAADSRPWYLQTNYSPEEIIIEPDGSVRGGTVVALVERLTAHEHLADRTYTEAFLMSFKSFTTVEEVVDLLIARFRIQPPEGLAPTELEEWSRLKQKVIQIRVINTLKSIIQAEDIIEKEDMYVLDKIKAFVTSEEVSGFPAAMHLVNLIEKRIREGTNLKSMINTHSGPPPAPIIPKNLKKLRFTDIDPLELARQFTLMESQLYQRIKPMECFLRAREQKTESNDNITTVIQASNRIACWVADLILSKEDSRKRANIMKHIISVADRCRVLNNFSTMVAITSGLNTPHIRRLKRTWDQVGQRHMALFSACEMTIGTEKNFTRYRQLMAQVTPPCVPFIGVFLSTLQFIQDGNPDTLPGGLVNFRKRQKASEVIMDIKRWQTQTFNLQLLPPVYQFIEDSLNQFNDLRAASDMFWELSLEREPREREDEKMARLLQESGFL